MEFAEWHAEWTLENWKRVIWSDVVFESLVWSGLLEFEGPVTKTMTVTNCDHNRSHGYNFFNFLRLTVLTIWVITLTEK